MRTKISYFLFCFSVFLWFFYVNAIEKGTVPNRFTLTPTIRRVDVLQNFDSAKAVSDRIIDSMDGKFARFSDFKDTNIQLMKIDTIKSNVVIDTPTIRKPTMYNVTIQSGNIKVTNDTVSKLVVTDTSKLTGIINTGNIINIGTVSTDSVMTTSLKVEETISTDSIKTGKIKTGRAWIDTIKSCDTALVKYLKTTRIGIDSIYPLKTGGMSLLGRSDGGELKITQLDTTNATGTSYLTLSSSSSRIIRFMNRYIGTNTNLAFISGHTDGDSSSGKLKFLTYNGAISTAGITIDKSGKVGLNGDYTCTYNFEAPRKSKIDTIVSCDTANIIRIKTKYMSLDTLRSCDTAYIKSAKINKIRTDSIIMNKDTINIGSRSSTSPKIRIVNIGAFTSDTNNVTNINIHGTAVGTLVDTVGGITFYNNYKNNKWRIGSITTRTYGDSSVGEIDIASYSKDTIATRLKLQDGRIELLGDERKSFNFNQSVYAPWLNIDNYGSFGSVMADSGIRVGLPGSAYMYCYQDTTWTDTLKGFSNTYNVDLRAIKTGSNVTLELRSLNYSRTSNDTVMILGRALPTKLRPDSNSTACGSCLLYNNNVKKSGYAELRGATGILRFYLNDEVIFTNSGNKGLINYSVYLNYIARTTAW